MRGRRVEAKTEKPAVAARITRSSSTGKSSVSKGVAGSSGRAGPPARIRIIGGRWKRTTLAVIDVPGLRPSPDRVRETVFNWLAHLLPDFTALRGLDLFAGTGALGFELASRGARRVVLVERHPQLIAQIGRTREKLGASAVEIVPGDAFAVARAFADDTFDVIFLDPPFDAGVLDRALRDAARLVRAGGLVYAESGAPLDAALTESLRLEIVRSGRAGQVHFHLLQRA
jgi:16S rRNA (guanine(966)-N(2))-methyltransferase RsmD